MSKNIKDIGKELLGRGLNSFHRKIGLTQLEKNNKMQDGILNGILSQVDDAYIEKTEQSNVIHLDGSGDGVVVVDSIEGNTMVNCVTSYELAKFSLYNATKQNDEYFKIQYGQNVNASAVKVRVGTHIYKPSTTYTVIVDIKENTCGKKLGLSAINSALLPISSPYRDFSNLIGVSKSLITTRADLNVDDKGNKPIMDLYFGIWEEDNGDLSNHITFRYWILEGDWTNREIPPFFLGLQSSFEEKVNDEGKYEIEILSNSENILNMSFKSVVNATCTNNKGVYTITPKNTTKNQAMVFNTYIPKGTYYYKGIGSSATQFIDINNTIVANCGQRKEYQIVLDRDVYNITYNWQSTGTTNSFTFDTTTEMVTKNQITNFVPHKQNKIKLLLDEPLRAIDNIKDRLCVKDGKLVVERNCKEIIYDGKENDWKLSPLGTCENNQTFQIQNVVGLPNSQSSSYSINNRFVGLVPIDGSKLHDKEYLLVDGKYGVCVIKIAKNKLTEESVNGLKTWLQSNPVKVIHNLEKPYYEEVLNEYGEPILLEGYENGTLYIDSTIVPTTTVRYTPKMESFKTLKEVKAKNAINDFDVTNNVIPYMMEVDIKLTELEMSAISTYNIKNIRKMEVLDMISMQERTFKMLERLIRGKSHTKQEMIDRVLLYEQAKRITTEQALELNLIIEEVYGA